MANAAALRAVLSKHTVKRLRELVRTRINLSGYSKMAKQDLISAILKRKELFADIVELEDSKNAAQDKQEERPSLPPSTTQSSQT